MPLAEYARKRNFERTTEPPKTGRARPNQNRFVIQKHAASRLHYDFRLEIEGALKSWAVPKGVPYAKGDKRLAVQVEDHPVSYADFEGAIPKGQYGGGTVMVWDSGTFSTGALSPLQELKMGKLHFVLDGKKLHGAWHLVRLRQGKNQWLLIKGGGDMKPISNGMDDRSALSGKTMKQLSEPGEKRKSNHKNGEPSRLLRGLPRPRAHISGSNKRRGVRPRRHEVRPSSGPVNFIEPMTARLVVTPPTVGDWSYEIKFDGFRALAFKQAGNVRILSRKEKDFAERFPEIADAVAGLKVEEAALDGEIVALDKNGVSSFQLLQTSELAEPRPPIFFYAFDLLQLNGQDLRQRPLVERKKTLAKLLGKHSGNIRFSASLGDDATSLLKRAEKAGLEGLIGKRKSSVYEAGRRSGSWIKLKLRHEQEFVIGGYTNPAGSRAHFGALMVGFFSRGKLTFCGKVGTGFDAQRLAALHSQFQDMPRQDCPFANLQKSRGSGDNLRLSPTEMRKCHWVEPKLVCQIAFSEWTRDQQLRQPVFLGLREDKSAREVVRERAE